MDFCPEPWDRDKTQPVNSGSLKQLFLGGSDSSGPRH